MDATGETALIHKTIKRITFLFRYMGLNVGIERQNKSKSRFIFIFNILWHNTGLCGEVYWFFRGIFQHKSFIELTYIAPCIAFSTLGNIKSVFLTLYENEVNKLIDVLSKMEIKNNLSASSSFNVEKDKIITTEHKFVTRVIKVLNVMYSVLLVAFALSPLCLTAMNYVATKELHLELPFLIVYPFDSYDIRFWPLAYVHQIWTEIIVVGNNCAVDYLFYIFCKYIRTQFRLLRHDIENVIPSNITIGRFTKDAIKSKLIELIKMHQHLISCTEVLERIYTKSMLQNFICSSVLICLTGFNVVAISDVFIVMTFLSFLFMSLFQIFFLCFFGDLVMTASMELRDAAYNSCWYSSDASLAKYILLIQTRSHTPCKLTAYNFYRVNLNAFMKILSTAWSYFALLQTVYSTPQIE